MRTFIRKIRILANISTILIAIFLGCIVFKMYLSSSNSSSINPMDEPNNFRSVKTFPDASNAVVGKSIHIENIDWQKNNKTLVLFVSPTCHFCTESAPFYKSLVRESSGKTTKLAVVAAQPTDESKSYLSKLGVEINDVYQSSLNEVDVDGTPTLFLVDKNGLITDIWVGKLTNDRERQVLNKL